MSSKKNRRALNKCETTTWIDELSELDPASLKILEERIVRNPIEQKPKMFIAATGGPESIRSFQSIIESLKEIQTLENDCPKPGQILDGYEVMGGMFVHDHYIVHLKPRRK